MDIVNTRALAGESETAPPWALREDVFARPEAGHEFEGEFEDEFEFEDQFEDEFAGEDQFEDEFAGEDQFEDEFAGEDQFEDEFAGEDQFEDEFEDEFQGELEGEAGWAGERSAGSTPGGRLVVEHLPLLRRHHGTAPDLVLAWNAMKNPGRVDVVVHLHGFSGRGPAMRLPRDMVGVSGLDLADPRNPATPGRTTPTLLVLPRGHYFGGRSGNGYGHPALHPPGAVAALVDEALARLGRQTGVQAVRGRLILTAHSGGGAALMRILTHTDPDEVHTFDALYTDPAPLIAWVRRRIARSDGAALRVLFRDHEPTAAHSKQVRAAVRQALAAAPGTTPGRFRVEATRVPHMQIPARYGWRLLADAGADLPGTAGPVPSPPVAAPTPEAEFYDEGYHDEGYHDEGYHDEGYHDGEFYDEGPAETAAATAAAAAAAAGVAGAAAAGVAAGQPTGQPRGANTTAALRRAWAAYLCAERRMVTVRLLSHRTPVNPLAADAFRALAAALTATGYQARSTWVYNCRAIRASRPGEQTSASLHAYGLAVDIDPSANPHRRHVQGPIVFSTAATQPERRREVAAARAGTVFTPQQVAAVEAIRTVDGLPVFGWGGRWRSSHDAMHFEIRLTPAQLQRGIASAATPAASAPVGRSEHETCESWEIGEDEAFGEMSSEAHDEASWEFFDEASDVYAGRTSGWPTEV